MRTLPFRSFAVSLVILSLCAVTYAQGGNSTVRGNVRDQQGNVVSGATVTLSNPQRNFSRTQTTSDDGTYNFNQVPPDIYMVQVEAAGFKKTSVMDVRASVDTTVDVD